MVVEITILRRPEERRIEYGFVDRCATGGVDSAVERICGNVLHCESNAKQRQAKVGTYRPPTARVALEIELWASDEGMMRDGEGAPIDVQLSIIQLSHVDAEASNVAGDD